MSKKSSKGDIFLPRFLLKRVGIDPKQKSKNFPTRFFNIFLQNVCFQIEFSIILWFLFDRYEFWNNSFSEIFPKMFREPAEKHWKRNVNKANLYENVGHMFTFSFIVFLQVLEIFSGNFLRKNCSRTHNDRKEIIKSSEILFKDTLWRKILKIRVGRVFLLGVWRRTSYNMSCLDQIFWKKSKNIFEFFGNFFNIWGRGAQNFEKSWNKNCS
jgi:hypothetical protein